MEPRVCSLHFPRVDARGLGPEVFHPAAVRLVEEDLVRLLVRHLQLERLQSVEKELVVAHLNCLAAVFRAFLARVLASERKKRSRTRPPRDRRIGP